MPNDNSVQDGGLLSDEALQDWLCDEINRFLNVERKMTRDSLAQAARVNVHMLDAMRKRHEGRRKVTPSQMLSICLVMGKSSVNGLLAMIGYGGASPLDEPDGLNLPEMIATGMASMSVIATAAADGRIDHTEEPDATAAADMIIATFLPMSSAGKAH